jgi:hypothetical protein
MIAATFLAVFFVPVFFVLMQRLSEFRRQPAIDSRVKTVRVSEQEAALVH